MDYILCSVPAKPEMHLLTFMTRDHTYGWDLMARALSHIMNMRGLVCDTPPLYLGTGIFTHSPNIHI